MRKIYKNTFINTSLFLLAMCLLAGCSIIPKPEAFKIVMLHDYKADSPCSAPLPVQIAIPTPSASAGLNTDRIAILSDNRQVSYIKGYKWENSNITIVQRQLVDAINSSKCFTGADPGSMTLRTDYRLTVDVKRMHFIHDKSGKRFAEVSMLLRLIEVSSGNMVGQYAAAANELCDDDDIFSGMEKALHAAIQGSLDWLRETVAADKSGK